MISMRKKPAEGFDSIHPVDQAVMVNNTSHKDGLCGALVSRFLRKRTSDHPLKEFEKPNYDELYSASASEEKQMLDHAKKTDQDPEDFALHQKDEPTQKKFVAPADLATFLDNDTKAAMLIYTTRSGGIHALGFFRAHEKCFMLDPNRFAANEKAKQTSCHLTTKTIQDLISRSSPSLVKVSYLPKNR